MKMIPKLKNSKKNVRKNTLQKQAKPWFRVSKPKLLGKSFDWHILRCRSVAIVFLCIWGVLWLRAGYLQIVLAPELRAQSSKQYNMTQLVAGKRGNIYDRNGEILARSVEVRSVYAHPHKVSDKALAAKTLAPLLKIDEERLNKQLEQDRSFIWISRKVDDATSMAIAQANIPGIGLTKEYERVYPYKHLAGQLLGFAGIDNVGLEGVERSFDTLLTGSSQKYVVPRKIAGRALYSVNDSGTIGQDIKLTLDVQIQFIAEEIISEAVDSYNAKWGGVLIADPRNGEILAWAQYPFFNPNNFRNYHPAIYRNRLANDALEPGSTLKPLIVAAAMEEKIVDKESTFYCENGVWRLEHIKIGKDKQVFRIGDDGRAFKDLTVEEIVKYSSNIGMAKITGLMGSEKLSHYLDRLGFGQSTGIGIAEGRGIVRAQNEYNELDLLSTGFGQSISVTGIQLLNAYNILVNDGKKVSLKLVKDDKENHVSERNIFSQENALEVLRMMESVVDGRGTGTRARVDGIRVAGKTGTAQKASKDGGYGEERMASFVGVLPADDPRYIIITILDEPQDETYGGRIAAPVFQKIATRTMAHNGEFPYITFASENSALPKGKAHKTIKEIDVKQGIIPDVTNLSLRRAMEVYLELGIIPKIMGQGNIVVRQEPTSGTSLNTGQGQNTQAQHKLYLGDEEISPSVDVENEVEVTTQARADGNI